MAAMLLVEQLGVAYTTTRTRQSLVAVQGANFVVNAGEFVALIGPSGCGKTTILNAVAGIQPISAGRIRLNGADVTGPGQACAMVFQSPALLPWRSVLGNVAYGLQLRGTPRREAQERARHYLELVGLGGFAESYPHELSGGMQQRANLARALAVRPQLLLFDEPLAALDARTREKMQLELQAIWLNSGVTALFVTHQIDEAILLADRVLVMSAAPGRIKANLPVPLPRPRSHHDRRAPEFIQLEATIREALEDTVTDARARVGSNGS
ncbi:MAG: ABC transporter ATP-binding protein [Anaerolineae bacterium]